MRELPRVLVLASGTPTGGGLGLREMVEYTRTDPPVLRANIVGVVSNHLCGGVRRNAVALGIPFQHISRILSSAESYRWFAHTTFQSDFVMCSGFLFPVSGLDSSRTLNIHPALLPLFGGKGMWGHHVHEAAMAAYHRGEIRQSGVTIHFVTDYGKQKAAGMDDPYDKGPIICQFPVLIRPDDTPESLAVRVNEVERVMQSRILDLVVNGHIRLDDVGVVNYDFAAWIIVNGMGGMIPSACVLSKR